LTSSCLHVLYKKGYTVSKEKKRAPSDKRDALAKLAERIRPAKSNQGPPIESPCKGVIIAVGYRGDKGVLIDWPEHEGFVNPMAYDMIESEDLEEAVFDGWPDSPGVYRCTVKLNYDPGGYWVGLDHIADPEWTFEIVESELIELP